MPLVCLYLLPVNHRDHQMDYWLMLQVVKFWMFSLLILITASSDLICAHLQADPREIWWLLYEFTDLISSAFSSKHNLCSIPGPPVFVSFFTDHKALFVQSFSTLVCLTAKAALLPVRVHQLIFSISPDPRMWWLTLSFSLLGSLHLLHKFQNPLQSLPSTSVSISSMDFAEFSVLHPSCQETTSLLTSFVSISYWDYLVLCEVSTRSPGPLVPVQ